jgi:hypothetical protein
MDESQERRRRRAYGLLRELPHNVSRPEAFRVLKDADCFDPDPHFDRQFNDFIGGFHKVCRKTRDVQQDMIPLWRLKELEDGTTVKEHYLGRFGEMDVDQHTQHLGERIKGIGADTNALYYYFDAIPNRKRTLVQRNLGWMPSRPPDSAGDEDED